MGNAKHKRWLGKGLVYIHVRAYTRRHIPPPLCWKAERRICARRHKLPTLLNLTRISLFFLKKNVNLKKKII